MRWRWVWTLGPNQSLSFNNEASFSSIAVAYVPESEDRDCVLGYSPDRREAAGRNLLAGEAGYSSGRSLVEEGVGYTLLLHRSSRYLPLYWMLQ